MSRNGAELFTETKELFVTLSQSVQNKAELSRLLNIPRTTITSVLSRASDISRKKKQNFAEFSGVNSRKNRPISRDFRGRKVKIRRKSPHFSGKKSIFEGFSGANS